MALKIHALMQNSNHINAVINQLEKDDVRARSGLSVAWLLVATKNGFERV